MPRLPPFRKPSSYIQYVGEVLTFPTLVTPAEGTRKVNRFIRLGARMGPLKLQHRFANVAAGITNVSSQVNFTDLELTPNHIAQLFIGVSRGGRVRVFHPMDERVLKWDQKTLDVENEDDTANLEHEDTPIESPRYEIWLAPTENFVPGFTAENVINDVTPARRVNVDLLVLAAKYTFEYVDPQREADVYDKLVRHQIPSHFVTFGGQV